jgi:DNA polymerase III delta prime subunit
MDVKVVFVRELAQKIKILVGTKQEISNELRALTSNISELSYKSWVLDTFIPGINNIFNYIVEATADQSSEEAQILKEVLYAKVLHLNEYLDPDNIYVGVGNTLTLSKSNKIKLTECETWSVAEDSSNLMVLNFDLHEYFELSDQARSFDHNLEVEHWDLFDLLIKIRSFSKSLRNTLVFGQDPKTEDDVKYFVVATCIDSFHHVYKYILQHPEVEHVPFHKIIYSLYEMAIKHNPFLDLKIRDIKRINKTTKQFRAGSKDEEGVEKQQKGRTRLAKVPKKEIVGLEEGVLNNIFGQDQAVVNVCNSIKRAYFGLNLRNKPIGAFLFYGPTSTGKTELAKVLATQLVKNKSMGLVHIPCNTLQAAHSGHTLIGAPPGYVGYEEQGLLAKAFNGESKFKIILFDEIDKAHPTLIDLLLEMLEEGQILGADGTVVDVKECVIIFTSNIGQQEANKSLKTAGFEIEELADEERKTKLRSQYYKSVEESLKPEFLARLNGKYLFEELSLENLTKTAELHLRKYQEDWKRRLKLETTEEIPSLIISKCRKKFGRRFHARDIKNYIDLEIIQKLGDFIIEQDVDLKKVEKLTLTSDESGFIFDILKKIKK